MKSEMQILRFYLMGQKYGTVRAKALNILRGVTGVKLIRLKSRLLPYVFNAIAFMNDSSSNCNGLTCCKNWACPLRTHCITNR